MDENGLKRSSSNRDMSFARAGCCLKEKAPDRAIGPESVRMPGSCDPHITHSPIGQMFLFLHLADFYTLGLNRSLEMLRSPNHLHY